MEKISNLQSNSEFKPLPSMGLELQLGLSAKGFFLKIQGDGITEIAVEFPFISNHIAHDELLHEMVYIARPLLYQALPNPQLQLRCSGELVDHPEFGNIIRHFLDIFHQTNQMLLAHLDKRNIAKNFKNRLFYELDQRDFHEFYEMIHAKDPEHTKYLEFFSSFDKISRETEIQSSGQLSPEELVDYIVANEIRTLITVNMYYLEALESRGIHGPTLLNFLGVECIFVDMDIYETVPFRKAAFHHDRFRRYSIHEHAQNYTDRALNLKNIRYIPTGQVKAPYDEVMNLRPDYGIVITSHCRLRDLFSNLESIVRVLESCREEFLFDDFQFWYFATRYYIQEHLLISAKDKRLASLILYGIYLNGISLLKYEVISKIKTDREIKLFGDRDWAKLFPHYYQNRYLEDYSEVFKDGQNISLLMNANYSYLESNPVFQRAVSMKVPFLCFPALFKTKELEALEHCEYANTHQLNLRIEEISQRSHQNDYLKARRTVAEWINSSFAEAANEILEREAYPTSPGIFKKKTDDHQAMAKQAYENYISNNIDSLDELFGIIFYNREPSKKFEDLRFFNRDYVQRILEFRKESAR